MEEGSYWSEGFGGHCYGVVMVVVVCSAVSDLFQS